MYTVAIIPIPTAADLQAMLNDQAQGNNVLVTMAVNPQRNELILVFQSRPAA